MFKEANERQAAYKSGLEKELNSKLTMLDATSDTWFDNSSHSVLERNASLLSTANLARRIAAVSDDEDQTELQHLASALEDQYAAFRTLAHDMAMAEKENNVGDLPVFSSEMFTDESKTASSVPLTDWDLFMAVEPREFVANNTYATQDPELMQDVAFDFITQATYGQSLGRKVKASLALDFAERVEQERQSHVKQGKRHVQAKKAEELDIPLSMYFL